MMSARSRICASRCEENRIVFLQVKQEANGYALKISNLSFLSLYSPNNYQPQQQTKSKSLSAILSLSLFNISSSSFSPKVTGRGKSREGGAYLLNSFQHAIFTWIVRMIFTRNLEKSRESLGVTVYDRSNFFCDMLIDE